jgi:site-specific DNA-methyltransferase (adenine-specific)
MAINIKNQGWEKTVESASGASLFFIDPPFNIGINYGSEISDRLTEHEYLFFVGSLAEATYKSAAENSFCLVNIPVGLIHIFSAKFSEAGWELHTIVARSARLPWGHSDRLPASWVPLLVFARGKPKYNHGKRPIKTCGSCGGPVGIYKTLPSGGVRIDSMWDDIAPVTRGKSRQANELSVAFLCRIVSLFSSPGDLVCDPFSGSGVSALASFFLKRKFIGGDISREWAELSRDRISKIRPLDIRRFIKWRDFLKK